VAAGVAAPVGVAAVSRDTTDDDKPSAGAPAGATGTAGTPADVAASVPPDEKLPGTVPAPELGPLFADSDSHSFRDRWRELQLRFVDDPKAAADDAASLVDEAVDALAASIRSQKEELTGAAAADTAHDTEQLRVRLRSYRDFLDRLLGL
jgi:hypothetical protein